MSRPDWLRTFVAVYRSGSVTSGAYSRGLSQPAASQQLASLSRALGAPLFVRTPRGVEPTAAAQSLYARTAQALDRLEEVLTGLEGAPVPTPSTPLRIGATAELFQSEILPRLVVVPEPLHATFGEDAVLHESLLRGDLDLVVTATPPPRRAGRATLVGWRRDYALVTPAAEAPEEALRTAAELGAWLEGRPWVSYSTEIPATRRFWLSALGRSFDGDVRLVAPDLRAVAAAVELGRGSSLLPRSACAAGLAEGRMVEVFDVGPYLTPEPYVVCTRRADAERRQVSACVRALQANRPLEPDQPRDLLSDDGPATTVPDDLSG